MEITRFLDLTDVPTSHDIDLRKYVLSAAGKYPEGRLTDFSQQIIYKTETTNFCTQNEILIFIQSEGRSHFNCVTEVDASVHDIITIPQYSKVVISNLEDAPSMFYCIHWSLD